jgi:hypothetical protein
MKVIIKLKLKRHAQTLVLSRERSEGGGFMDDETITTVILFEMRIVVDVCGEACRSLISISLPLRLTRARPFSNSQARE